MRTKQCSKQWRNSSVRSRSRIELLGIQGWAWDFELDDYFKQFGVSLYNTCSRANDTSSCSMLLLINA